MRIPTSVAMLSLIGCTTLDVQEAARLGAADCNCKARGCKTVEFSYKQGDAAAGRAAQYQKTNLRVESDE